MILKIHNQAQGKWLYFDDVHDLQVFPNVGKIRVTEDGLFWQDENGNVQAKIPTDEYIDRVLSEVPHPKKGMEPEAYSYTSICFVYLNVQYAFVKPDSIETDMGNAPIYVMSDDGKTIDHL